MPRGLCGLVATLCLFLLVGCKASLYSNLSEREANEIVALLQGVGIDASRSVTDGVATVLVPKDLFAASMAVLQAEGLPRREHATINDIFSGDGFVITQMEERARYIYAMAEELSHTIMSIDGVIVARVHLVLPSTEISGKVMGPSSASVFVKHKSEMDLQPLVPDLKLLVGNSIEGLDYQNVTVLLVPSATPVDMALVEFTRSGWPLGLWAGLVFGGLVLMAALVAGGMWIASGTKGRFTLFRSFSPREVE